MVFLVSPDIPSNNLGLTGVCGVAGMSGGHTVTSGNENVYSIVSFRSFQSNGALSVRNSTITSLPNRIVSSMNAPVIITLSGLGNTTCEGYVYSNVGLYRVDQRKYVSIFTTPILPEGTSFSVVGTDYATSEAIYEVRVSNPGLAYCTTTVQDVVLSMVQPVCV